MDIWNILIHYSDNCSNHGRCMGQWHKPLCCYSRTGDYGFNRQYCLAPDLMILTDPLIISGAGVMYIVEFFADKIPGVDNGWDTVHTFIRIPLGALLAAAAVGDANPSVAIRLPFWVAPGCIHPCDQGGDQSAYQCLA